MMIGPMKRKMITTSVISFILPTILFVVIFGMYSSKQKEEIARLEQESQIVFRYVFSGDMPVDHIVTSNDIKAIGVKEMSAPQDSYQLVYSGDSDIIIRDDRYSLIGQKLKIPAYDKTIVTENMFYKKEDKVSNDTRIKEFNMITLPSDLQQGDYVDIRILFPTGEDYLVLVGKEIKQLGQNASSNSIFIEVSEEEMIKLSGAIIESYISDSVNLYAVKYVNNYQQLFKEVHVDYVDKYETALNAMIEADYEKALAEVQASNVASSSESGESGEVFEPIVTKKTANDYNINDIAAVAGIDRDTAMSIKMAFEDDDTDLLAFYRNQTVVKSDLLEPTYPIRTEVYALIQNNPNIIETLKAKYNIETLKEQRLSLINTSVFQEDIYTGELKENTSVLSAVAKNIEEEITAQKAERKDFLQNMIRNNVAADL